jgi:hypothetical protein
MGQSLTNKNIKDTYKGLLKTADNNEITSEVQISDGDGNDTGVYLNTDGSVKATGTVSFGELKDSGEDITVTKFVDEADGIGNNDNDTTIPTSAAVKDYVDTNVTAQDLDFEGDTGTGAVDLDSQLLDIAGGTGITTSAADQTLTIDIDSTVATLSDSQTLTNKSIDLTNNTISGTTAEFNSALSDNDFATLAGSETLTNKSIDADNNTISNLETDNLKAGVLDTDLSSVSASDDTLASAKAIKTYVDTQITAEDLDFSGNTGTGSVDLDTQTFAITGTGIATTTAANQGLAVDVPATNLSNTPASTTLEVESSTGNNTTLPAATTSLAGVMTGADKTKLDGIEAGAEVNVVTSVNTETGDVVLDTNDVSEGTSNLYYTDTRADARVNLQTGANLDLSQKSTSDLSEGTNLYYTEARVSANTDVAANTLKVGITTQQAADIQTNNAKVSNVTTNLDTTETGTSVTVTSSDGTDGVINAATTIVAGVMTSADKIKLDGIATGATANAGTVTEVTVGTGLDVANGTTTPNVTLDLTEITVGAGLDTTTTGISLDLSEFTDMTADMIETDEFIVLDGGAERRKAINEVKSTLFSNNDLYKVIGVATDHSSRVLSDSGTSEGATSIMQNFEILINN